MPVRAGDADLSFASNKGRGGVMTGRGHQNFSAADIVWRNGGDPSIKYARFLTDEANPTSPLIILSKFEPGSVVAPHTHASNYFEYIVEGEQTVGKVKFGAGDVRLVKGRTGYGPIKVGPQGCTVLIVFENASGAMTQFLPLKGASGAEQVEHH